MTNHCPVCTPKGLKPEVMAVQLSGGMELLCKHCGLSESYRDYIGRGGLLAGGQQSGEVVELKPLLPEERLARDRCDDLGMRLVIVESWFKEWRERMGEVTRRLDALDKRMAWGGRLVNRVEALETKERDNRDAIEVLSRFRRERKDRPAANAPSLADQLQYPDAPAEITAGDWQRHKERVEALESRVVKVEAANASGKLFWREIERMMERVAGIEESLQEGFHINWRISEKEPDDEHEG